MSGRREGTERGKQAGTREHLLHEKALAGGGVDFARRRLFLDLAETEFEHFGCRMWGSETIDCDQLGVGD